MAEEYGKDTEGRRLSCDIFFFVTAANKRNSRNFAMKRYKIKAHGEQGDIEEICQSEEDAE